MKRIFWAFLVSFALGLSGCSTLKTPHTVAPGSTVAATPLDSDTYNLLLLTQNLIDGTRAALAANEFTTVATPFVKQGLNQLINAYDALYASYGPYHAAVLAGTATAAQAAAVTSATAAVNAATTALTTAKVSPGAKAIGRQLVLSAVAEVDAGKDSPIDLNKISTREVIQ